jgi:hypothetical protein
MIRLTNEQWERIRDHFPEEHIPDGRPGRKPVPTRLEAVLWISLPFAVSRRNGRLLMRTQDRRRRGVEILGTLDRRTQDRPRAFQAAEVAARLNAIFPGHRRA